jgi:hypothetical protein
LVKGKLFGYSTRVHALAPPDMRAVLVFGAARALSLSALLAGTVKLWAYIKYCHPGVTASGVDWDAALADAAPRALTAQTVAEFSAVPGRIEDEFCTIMAFHISDWRTGASADSFLKT